VGRRLSRVGARASAATAIAVALAVTGVASPALAHNSLTGSSPADGATVARPPATVRLTFLAGLDPATTKISVTGPDGSSATGGAPAYARNRVTVPFRPGAAGRYTVAYQVASDDGHPIKGRVRFTLTTGAAPAAPTAAATSAAPPTPPATSPTGAGSPAALDPASDEEDSGGTLGWVLGALVLILLLGVGALLLRRRARA
jgi:methionine-rich copper-binding protein CopC